MSDERATAAWWKAEADGWKRENDRHRSLYVEAVAERDALRARIDAHEGKVEQREEINRLISESSLGTPEAVAWRDTVPWEVSHAVTRAADHLRERDLFAMALEEEQELHGETKTERDRLRAIVDAVRESVETCEQEWQPNNPPCGADAVAFVTLFRQLDVSPDTGGTDG